MKHGKGVPRLPRRLVTLVNWLYWGWHHHESCEGERERERVHVVSGAVHTYGYMLHVILNMFVSITRKLCLSPGKPSCILWAEVRLQENEAATAEQYARESVRIARTTRELLKKSFGCEICEGSATFAYFTMRGSARSQLWFCEPYVAADPRGHVIVQEV